MKAKDAPSGRGQVITWIYIYMKKTNLKILNKCNFGFKETGN